MLMEFILSDIMIEILSFMLASIIVLCTVGVYIALCLLIVKGLEGFVLLIYKFFDSLKEFFKSLKR